MPPLSTITYCSGAKISNPLFLKSGDSTNNYTNDNGINSKLKFLYNMAKSARMLKYGTKTFSLHHMNYVFVEAWDAFKMSAGNIIRDSFVKANLPHLIPTSRTTDTQACDTYIQVYYEAKAEK